MICFLFVVCLFGVAHPIRFHSQYPDRSGNSCPSCKSRIRGFDDPLLGKPAGCGYAWPRFNRMLLQIRKLMKLSERERQKREAERAAGSH